jgi:hypothetical protein
MPDKSSSKKINVTITLFPPFSKKNSKEQITITVERNSTVRDLLESLVNSDAHFKMHLGKISQEEDVRLRALILHNDHMARLDQRVHDGDRFNFLHPLQGG